MVKPQESIDSFGAKDILYIADSIRGDAQLRELESKQWNVVLLETIWNIHFSVQARLAGLPDTEGMCHIVAALMFMRQSEAPVINRDQTVSPGYSLPSVVYRSLDHDTQTGDRLYVFSDAENDALAVTCRSGKRALDSIYQTRLVTPTPTKRNNPLLRASQLDMVSWLAESERGEVALGAVLGALAIARVRSLQSEELTATN